MNTSHIVPSTPPTSTIGDPWGFEVCCLGMEAHEALGDEPEVSECVLPIRLRETRDKAQVSGKALVHQRMVH
jgi:hypothetical protein